MDWVFTDFEPVIDRFGFKFLKDKVRGVKVNLIVLI